MIEALICAEDWMRSVKALSAEEDPEEKKHEGMFLYLFDYLLTAHSYIYGG